MPRELVISVIVLESESPSPNASLSSRSSRIVIRKSPIGNALIHLPVSNNNFARSNTVYHCTQSLVLSTRLMPSQPLGGSA